jgi:hypothetical protein
MDDRRLSEISAIVAMTVATVMSPTLRPNPSPVLAPSLAPSPLGENGMQGSSSQIHPFDLMQLQQPTVEARQEYAGCPFAGSKRRFAYPRFGVGCGPTVCHAAMMNKAGSPNDTSLINLDILPEPEVVKKEAEAFIRQYFEEVKQE